SGSMSKKKKDWKTEKERLLQLDREDRRKEYRKGFTQLDDIPTWREENRCSNPSCIASKQSFATAILKTLILK
uniref:O-acetyl-ADP-ribose deacetylase MACROD2-like n=1 Tax=Poecilia latipinna TaxID=48699 RepID=A0A3B3UT09_9TELE